MRVAMVLAALLLQQAAANAPVAAADAPVATAQHERWERSLTLRAGASGQACAELDAEVYEHAAPALADLRIFPTAWAEGGSAAHETPYALTLSEAATAETEDLRVLNLGRAGGRIQFDLEMPRRPYSQVTLRMDAALHDWLATATVTGETAAGGEAHGVALGQFTLFDLAGQRLSRDTTLALAEATFPYLHVTLAMTPAPGTKAPSGGYGAGLVRGAEAPPSREAQVVYTTLAETRTVTTDGRESRAVLTAPAEVPVERVEFVLEPSFHGNFSRAVRVRATTEDARDGAAAPAEVVSGEILRVHASEAGHEIQRQELGVPAILASNLGSDPGGPAKVVVVVENGDDQPLPIAAVRLEMRQRKVCFAAGGPAVALFYGDRRLAAPEYDYARLFPPEAKPDVAVLGPERANPGYVPAAEARAAFTERHPEVLWIALIGAVSALGLVAIRASRMAG